MNDLSDSALLTPFEILVEYERLSLAHAAGAPEQTLAPGLWRGIGFRVGRHHLSSSLAEVNEILAFPQVTQVPGTRPWLLGVANVRGNLVPLVDLNLFLTGERSLVAEASRILIVRQPGGSVGLLVDEVLGQRNFATEQQVGPAADQDERFAQFILENFSLGDAIWGQFSMAALVRAVDFTRAAA